MAGYFQLIPGQGYKVLPGTKLIKATEFEELIRANLLYAKVREAAAKAGEHAEAIYKERHDQGYADGKEEGKEEYTEKIMEMVFSSIESIEALESQLVEVVMQAVTKIIGEIDVRERVVRIVQQALNAVRGSKSATLRVSSNDEQLLRESLSGILLNSEASQGYIKLIADPHLRSGDCVIETEQGVVDSSLSLQLKILKKSMQDHVIRKQ